MTSTLRIVAPAAVAYALVAGGQVAHAQDRESVEGVWSTPLTAPDHPAWRIEDRVWGGGPRAGYDHLRSLLADPSNDSRPLQELAAEARKLARGHVDRLIVEPRKQPSGDPATDPAIQCQPPGLNTLVMAPLPVAIAVSPEHVVIHHEFWNTIRTIPVSGGRERPSSTGPASRLGSSTARFEGATLIVESVNVPAFELPMVITADGARVVERYTPSDDGARLDVELIIDDARTFREPLVLGGVRVRTPAETIVESPPCELISGEFER